jgi:chromosome segregation ATPase
MADPSDQMASVTRDVERFNRTLSDICRRLQQLGWEGENYATQVWTAKAHFEIDNLPERLRTIGRDVDAIQTDKRNYRTQRNDFIAQLRTLDRENEQLEQDKSDLRWRLDHSGANSTIIAELRARKEELKRQVALLKHEKATLQTEKTTLTNRNHALEAENVRLQQLINMHGQQPSKPKCRGCEKKVPYHACKINNGWVRR